MTSQRWRSPSEVDRPLWKHWLVIVIPDTVQSDTAFLWITGGNNGGAAPASASTAVRDLARETGTVAAELSMVPNQPLSFTGGGGARYEDEIIAFTFDRFLATADGTWPALLPMVKSAVRAMDTIQAHVPAATGGAVQVERFVVGGASKRGWTTWLTAAVDARVAGIVPVVIDVLNMDEQMAHHRAVYEGVTSHIVGGYSDAIHDYVDLNVIQRMDTPEGQALLAIVDPYEYRDRLSLPKCLINATGDQFFVPDSAQFYVARLEGPKCLRYVPNTNHSVSGTPAALAALGVFYEAMLDGAPLPRFSWTAGPGPSIRIETVDAPLEAKLWQATNLVNRDFRLYGAGPVWTSSSLPGDGAGVYVGRVALPPSGFRGFFVELTFARGGSTPWALTTEIAVVGSGGGQVPGDCNQDAKLDLSDAVLLLMVLFGEGAYELPCGDGSADDPGNELLADASGDGKIDIADAIGILGFLFGGGPPPALGSACMAIEGCPEACRAP
jgi:PhoPQ-activated pathogenicity-related protein